MFAELLHRDGVAILNNIHVNNHDVEVPFNQVVARFNDDDECTRRVIAAVQSDGRCWVGPSVWKGQVVMRISVSCWVTTVRDVEISALAILECAGAVNKRI